MLKGLLGAAVAAGWASRGIAGEDDRAAGDDLDELVGFTVAHVSRTMRDEKTGESVRLVYGNNGEFCADYRVAPGGFIPFEHYHSEQSEIFAIKGGRFTMWLDGKEHHAKVGDVVVVKPGMHHVGRNDGDEEMRAVVTFDPLLDADEMFRRYWKLCDSGKVDAQGRPSLDQLLFATCDLASKTYDVSIPAALQDIARDAAKQLKHSAVVKVVAAQRR